MYINVHGTEPSACCVNWTTIIYTHKIIILYYKTHDLLVKLLEMINLFHRTDGQIHVQMYIQQLGP